MLRISLADGTTTRLRADEFEGFGHPQVSDDGTVYVSGFRYPSHGVWRLDETAAPERVCTDTRATISADGARMISGERLLVLHDLHRQSDREMRLRHTIAQVPLPVLGMAKVGRGAFGPDRIVVLTDAYTVANVVLA